MQDDKATTRWNLLRGMIKKEFPNAQIRSKHDKLNWGVLVTIGKEGNSQIVYVKTNDYVITEGSADSENLFKQAIGQIRLAFDMTSENGLLGTVLISKDGAKFLLGEDLRSELY